MTAANDNLRDYNHAWISRFGRQVAVDWIEIVKEEALKIDPATAEVDWMYGLDLDPYGVYPELPEELRQVGRQYFARRHGSEVWVEFGDLPAKTRDELWERHKYRLSLFVRLEVPLDSDNEFWGSTARVIPP